MRYTPEQIRPGITHDLPTVREECLHYFTGCRRELRRVMPEVIDAIRKFGRTEAFTFIHAIQHVVPTAETLDWLIEELSQSHGGTRKRKDYVHVLSGLVNNADVADLRPRESEILSARGLEQKDAERLRRRLSFADRDGDALWRELEELCEGNKGAYYINEFPNDEADDIVEALANQGDVHADRVMELLARSPNEEIESDPFYWLELSVVTLAGRLRHEPAIPLLIDKLHRDEEGLSEDTYRALIEIGTDPVVEAVRAMFFDADWGVRMSALGVLEYIHTDRCVEVGLELAQLEIEEDLQEQLMYGLAGHFSTEGIDKAREWLLEGPTYEVLLKLVPVCIFMGVEFPELAEWREQSERQRRRSNRLFQNFAPFDSPGRSPDSGSVYPPAPEVHPPVRKDAAAGRNDPCPCGSGKKYKKCCMRK